MYSLYSLNSVVQPGWCLVWAKLPLAACQTFHCPQQWPDSAGEKLIQLRLANLNFLLRISDKFVVMSDIKYTYFDLRVKGEPARLLLAYSGLK